MNHTFHVLHAPNEKSEYFLKILQNCIKMTPLEKAEVIIVLGGDGYMLKMIHYLWEKMLHPDVCLFGINCGTVGFLMNALLEEDLHLIEHHIESCVKTRLTPLKAIVETIDGKITEIRAINEISLHRTTHQTSHLSIAVNDIVRMPMLIGDGVLIATPAGSTAYNYSAGGPILPLGSNGLVLTPLNAYQPRRWPGAILDDSARITCLIDDAHKRPVNLTADFISIENILKVEIMSDKSTGFHLLFDKTHNLEARILQQQFWPIT